MEIKEFIEKAIEGGWRKDLMSLPNIDLEIEYLTRKQGNVWGVWFNWIERDMNKMPLKRSIEVLEAEILLDPKSWEAVGKIEDWNFCGKTTFSKSPAEHYAHDLITHLFEGGTVETYLKTL